MRALRFDVLKLDAFTRTPQGGIRVPAALARTGVQEYRRADGSIVREYRPHEEVFHKDAVASFENAPLTIGHVNEVNPDNWGGCAVGHVIGAPKQDGKFLAAETQIMRADAIKRVESGELKELSCGYEVEIDPTPGVTTDGERYDAIQRSIRGNHVALLPAGAGRAGPEVRLRTDSAEDAARYPGGVAYRLDNEDAYPTRVSTQSTQASGDSPATIQTATAGAAAKTSEARSDASVEALLGRIDSLTAANSELTKRLDAMPGAIEAAATARAALISQVAPLMPKNDKGEAWRADGKTDMVVIKEALSVLRPEAKFDGKSDDYVRGAYEEALRSAETSRARAGAAQGPLHPAFRADSMGDADMDDLEMKNKAAKQKSADAWKTPARGALTRDSLRK